MSFKIPDPNVKSSLELYYELMEKTACFTGHRPNKLGGYDLKNPVVTKLKDSLEKVIEHLITEEGITRFITGGALGTDQIAFKRVHDLKSKYPHINNILAVPFKDQSFVWSQNQKNTYNKIFQAADEVVFVDTLKKYQPKGDIPVDIYHPSKMSLRNNYMVDNSKIVVAVYDGSKGGTCNCVRYAHNRNRSIYTLNPKRDFDLEIKYGF